ncbi:P-loop containing nucleoside triphosphate hydrolase superfamily protein [Trifolium repens]|nr:P-loop containing nucleoside triphosphate hydrolase superfamily protein [Trifolium repens]
MIVVCSFCLHRHARDALAKFIYASLFDWLADQVNKSLEVGKRRTGRSISILDIYGFESFQLCITYANERLQQHFNRRLFKLEQQDYEIDGVDWTKHLQTNPYFKGDWGRGWDWGRGFSVCHYAGEVLYDTSGVLEKNKDPMPSDSIQLLSSCSCKLLQPFSKMLNHQSQKQSNSQHAGAFDSQKQSVGTKFKGQLFKLMHQLESMTPHFIRYIKPNAKQHSGIYNEDLVLQQLKCCGVLVVVRISRVGYPT